MTFSFRTLHKFVVLFLIAAACNVAMMVYLQVRVAESQESIGMNAERTAVLVSKTITRDYLKDYRTVIETLDDKTPEYARLKALLIDSRDSYGYRFTFLFRFQNDKIQYLVDSEAANSTDYSRPGETEPTEDMSMTTLLRNPRRSFHDRSIVENSRWGSYISGFSPVFDSNRACIGYVEVDADMKFIRGELYGVYRLYVQVFVVMNVLIVVFILMYAYTVFRNLKRAKLAVRCKFQNASLNEPPVGTYPMVSVHDDDEDEHMNIPTGEIFIQPKENGHEK